MGLNRGNMCYGIVDGDYMFIMVSTDEKKPIEEHVENMSKTLEPSKHVENASKAFDCSEFVNS